MNKIWNDWRDTAGFKRTFKQAAEELESRAKEALKIKEFNIYIKIIHKKSKEFTRAYWKLTKSKIYENETEELKAELNGIMFIATELSIILRKIETYYLNFEEKVIYFEIFIGEPKGV